MRSLLSFLLITFTPFAVLAEPLLVIQYSTIYTEDSVVNGKISFTYQLTPGTTRFFEWRGSYWLHYDGWEEQGAKFISDYRQLYHEVTRDDLCTN